jgi:hypothetical protein
MGQVYGVEIACVLNSVVSYFSVSIMVIHKSIALVRGIDLIAGDV